MARSPNSRNRSTIPDLIAEARRTHTQPDTSWFRVGVTEGFVGEASGGTYIGVFFENDWATDTTDNKAPLSFYLSDDGEVRMRGMLDDTSATEELVFTLPAGFRPEFSEPFKVTVTSGATGTLWIDPDGSVRFVPDVLI